MDQRDQDVLTVVKKLDFFAQNVKLDFVSLPKETALKSTIDDSKPSVIGRVEQTLLFFSLSVVL